jgi:hypothetical protein
MELMTAPEVARDLGKHRATVCAWVRSGLLVPTVKLGNRYYFAPEYIARMKPSLINIKQGRPAKAA